MIKHWSAHEIERLKIVYSQPVCLPLNLLQLSDEIGRSSLAIQNKANELGLTTKNNAHRVRPHRPPEELSKSYRTKIEWSKLTDVEKHERKSRMTREYIREHGHPRGKREIRICPVCGKFFDVEASSTKKYCSPSCGLHRPRGERTYTRGNGGRRADLNNIYFRSRWEANYARYLNFLIQAGEILKWEFEPDTFWFEKIKRGVRSYKPDFKVYCTDGTIEYHEVKGWDYPRGKTARKRMAKYYPKIKLLLADEDFFKAVSKKHFDKIIPGWEYRDRNKS